MSQPVGFASDGVPISPKFGAYLNELAVNTIYILD